jgi:hypothetical protein
MKTFIKNICLFLLLQPLIYLLFLEIWGHVVPVSLCKNLKFKQGGYGHLHRRIMELKTYGPVDILFLGSSHSYRGFDPRIFAACGIKTFNMGSNSQTPIQTEILLGRYLSRLKPKMIIYEISPGIFANDGIESGLDLIANDELGSDLAYMVFKLSHIRLYHSMIFKFFKEAMGEDPNFTQAVMRGKDTYISGGFIERELSYYSTHEIFPPVAIEFKKYQQDAFERILRGLKNKGIEVVLVQAQVVPALYESHITNPDIDRYYKKFADYYNFNEILNLSSEEYFYDRDHMNQKGVVIFNQALLDILQREKTFGLLGFRCNDVFTGGGSSTADHLSSITNYATDAQRN